MKEIPLSVPNLGADIIDNLRTCVESGWVSTGGPFITEFEEKVARYIGATDAVGCQSGTAGLHTALRLLGVVPGDLVLAPTLTFIAAVNPIRYQFADPVFLDCDDSFCIDPDKLERYCVEECRTETRNGALALVEIASGRQVKAVIPVHVFGFLADMERITDIAARHHLKVLEDATEALGSFWESGRCAGMHAGLAGDAGVFSFNANKIITTGGGGMIVSRDAGLLAQARYLTTTAKDDGLYFAHGDVGYNYRMLNLQAALGVSQIDALEGFIETKRRNLALYADLLEGAPGLRLLPLPEGIRSNAWFYSLYIDDDAGTDAGERRDRIMRALIAEGIQCRPVWKLVHTQAAYSDCRAYGIEQACDYERHILNLPCSTNLPEEDVHHVCARIRKWA
ncbi:MAG: DegT/DnrJ/EryC1/StrS family aminotransferase [Clostridiales Family XIII bacterium]|jgi:aminotransferase in exopolysaccharide biosynthesis|nr:DegT/DnrJ/EryC1/StrS family aminotransferase [Clostridiales Family XIII bacterium]